MRTPTIEALHRLVKMVQMMSDHNYAELRGKIDALEKLVDRPTNGEGVSVPLHVLEHMRDELDKGEEE